MSKVTVYSKPKCVQCKYTKRFLDNEGIQYTSIDVIEEPKALERIKNMGFSSLPVVEVEGWEPFTGYQPERLKQIKEI